jgi:hypothetical protein
VPEAPQANPPCLRPACVQGKAWDSACAGVAKENKTPAETKLIEHALHNNSYFTCLDEEQIQRQVSYPCGWTGQYAVVVTAPNARGHADS